jgi:glucuronokinase
MSTGRSIVSTCPARAALAGNPSDGYGGAVVAVPIPDLTAVATIEEASGAVAIRTADTDLRRLLEATLDAVRDRFGDLEGAELSVSTSIPRSVGLAGSSAVIIATLRALGAWFGHRWEPVELAELALSVERDQLGIPAGLQDRLVQAVGKPVSMTFDPIGFEPLDLPEELHLFVAWSTEPSAPSGTVYRSLRRRFDAGDERVHDAMRELAVQAARARRGIIDGDAALLADAMHRTMAIRLRVVDIDGDQRRLIEIGRRLDAAVNSAGPGGSIVGLARHADHLASIVAAYRTAELGVLELA